MPFRMPVDPFADILAANEAMPDANTGDPIADALTWEQTGPGLDHPAADIPHPNEGAPQDPQLTGYKGPKVSGSFRGMTDDGLRRSKGVFGEADARIAAQTGDAAALATDQMAKSRQHYDAVGDSLALAIQKTAEFQQRESELQHQVIDFHNTAAEVEQRAAAQALAERQQYVAAYKEQLAVVKQLALQSGNPMGQLGRGEAVGLAGAQFAQGFLAAQGVNIDVAGQVDRWVERSINEHQMKIQNLRASAEDQMHLYELARQNSADEWEARQRYRGFVIGGLQAAIQLNASRFQSDIAMARANEQIARLQVEADTTERSIADKHFDRVLQISQLEYSRASQMGQLAIQQRAAALQQAQLDWDMDPRNPKNRGNMEAPYDLPALSDPEEVGADGQPLVDANGNKVLLNKWKVNSKILKDDKLAREVYMKGTEARQNYGEYLRASNEMYNAYIRAKKVRDSMEGMGSLVGAGSWEALARMDKTGAVQEFLQARDAFSMAKVYNESGKAATDVEYKRQQAQAYVDKLFAYNGNKGEKSMAKLREDGRSKFENVMSTYGFEQVAPDQVDGTPNPEQISRTPVASPRTKATDQATRFGEDPTPGTVEKIEKRAFQKDSDDIQRDYRSVSGAWADFKGMDKIPDHPSESVEKYLSEQGQSEKHVALELLASAYAKPHVFYKQAKDFYGVDVSKNQETPAEIRKAAYKALTEISMGEAPNGSVPSADLMEWAQYLKTQIDTDPDLKNAIEHDEDVDSPFVERLMARPGKKN